MLTNQPQNLGRLFLDSFKAYRKLFLRFLPLASLVLVFNLTTDLVVAAIHDAAELQLATKIYAIPMMLALAFLYSFILYWAISFVAEALEEQTKLYYTSFKNTLRKFWRIVVAVIIVVLMLMLLGAAFWVLYKVYLSSLLDYLKLHYQLIRWFTLALLFVMVFWMTSFIFTFALIYPIELLLKDTGIWNGLKNSLVIASKSKNHLRFTLGIILGSFFFWVIIYSLFLVLLLFLYWLGGGGLPFFGNFSELSLTIMGYLVIVLIWFPYYIGLLVIFYHDLRLRNEHLITRNKSDS